VDFPLVSQIIIVTIAITVIIHQIHLGALEVIPLEIHLLGTTITVTAATTTINKIVLLETHLSGVSLLLVLQTLLLLPLVVLLLLGIFQIRPLSDKEEV
jgi:hypothetical protein